MSQRKKPEIEAEIMESLAIGQRNLLAEYIACLIVEMRFANDVDKGDDVTANQGAIKAYLEIIRKLDLKIDKYL